MDEKEVRAVIRDPAGFTDFVCKMKGIKRAKKESFIEDLLYDTPDRKLKSKGEKLRIRSFNHGARNMLCWKGIKKSKRGVKSRKEIEVQVSSFRETAEILESLGYVLNKVIKRKAWYFFWGGTVIRLEFFPVEDVWLAEVEGSLEKIEQVKAFFPDIAFGPYTLNKLLKTFGKKNERTG